MPPHTQQRFPDPESLIASPDPSWLDGFNRHVRQQPHRTAAIAGERAVSYRELETRSNRIAHMLSDAGIGEGDHVGSGFDRSVDLIAALVGIVKSGAAYVPLDPAYPPARISRMIASAGLKTVISSTELAPCFPDVEVIVPDDAPTTDLPEATYNPASPIYAIFTSGSTGEPKAASVFHSGFANLLSWYVDELGLGPEDRTLVISSPSFDLTQKNLFAPLLTGGTLVLDDCRTYDITRILRLIAEHRVTLVNCTPSAFYPLVDAAAAGGFQALSSLRFAVLGGEPISIPRLRAWLENPRCRAEVVNSYGPTECTDICLFHRLHRGNLDQFPFVPLGRKIPNVHVIIRDENLNSLPDGETGELCISGAGVGGGYINDRARSAERFVAGTYRTGDLAKRLPCGAFEFRGRADHQVKVNGFRIELGEIEIALNEHADVREAVVTADDGRLTAHIQGGADAVALRAHLAERLPAYMIPAEFLPVVEFPLTPNGKVDRKALTKRQADDP
jgi:amino acid adenylation domain-containing protein